MPTTALDINAVMLAATETVLFTVPASNEYHLPVIRFTNFDTSDHTITVYNYKNGTETATDTTAEFNIFTIQARSTVELGPYILPADRRISALADVANFVTARVHGWTSTP